MPMAVRLSTKTIPLISANTLQTERELYDELETSRQLGETRYFIKDITINNISYPWVNMREDYFLDHFATMPPGIDVAYVKVTQVKS